MSEENLNSTPVDQPTDNVQQPAADTADTTPHTPQPETAATPWGQNDEYTPEETSFIEKKGFKSPKDLIKSYQNLESKLGSSITLPKEDDEQAKKDFYQKLGVPDTPDGYNIQTTNPDGPELLKFAHQCNLTQNQAAHFVELINKMQQAEESQEAQEYQDNFKKLVDSWGDQRAAKEDLLNKGLNAHQITKEQLRSMAQAVGLEAAISLIMTSGKLKSDNFGMSGGGTTGAVETVDGYIESKRKKA